MYSFFKGKGVERQYMMVYLLVYKGLCGRDIVEHRYTEKEPFSVINVYWYNRHIYSGDPEKPLTCSPIKYRYHVIFTLSKDPDEQIKQMIQHYVEKNKIEGLYRQNHYGICLNY